MRICMTTHFLSSLLPFSLVLVAEERSVFLREQGNRMYSVWTYFLARISIDILPTFLCSLGLALICFWMMGRKKCATARLLI